MTDNALTYRVAFSSLRSLTPSLAGTILDRVGSEENFFDTKSTTYYGRALAVIRAVSENGTIRLSAKAEGLETASVEIKVTNA